MPVSVGWVSVTEIFKKTYKISYRPDILYNATMKTLQLLFSYSSDIEMCEVTQTAVKENKVFRVIKTEMPLFIIFK